MYSWPHFPFHNFLLSLHLFYLTIMRILAGKLEERDLGIFWSLPFFWGNWAVWAPCSRSSFLPGNLGSVSHTWLSLSVSWDLPFELLCQNLGLRGQSTAADVTKDELGTHSLNMTTLNHTILTKLKIPENGEKKNPFLPFPYPPDISNYLATKNN